MGSLLASCAAAGSMACSGADPALATDPVADGGRADARAPVESGAPDAHHDAGGWNSDDAGDGDAFDAQATDADAGGDPDSGPTAMQCQSCYALGSKSQNCLVAESPCCQEVCGKMPSSIALCPDPADADSTPCIFDYADGGGCVQSGAHVVTVSNTPGDPGYCNYPVDNDAGYAVCVCSY